MTENLFMFFLAGIVILSVLTFAQVADKLEKATERDTLDIAADLIEYVDDSVQRSELKAIYKRRQGELIK